MTMLEEENISCPYCGETISILIDEQEAGEQYTEDCQVCCRPIVFYISNNELSGFDSWPKVTAYREDDTI